MRIFNATTRTTPRRDWVHINIRSYRGSPLPVNVLHMFHFPLEVLDIRCHDRHLVANLGKIAPGNPTAINRPNQFRKVTTDIICFGHQLSYVTYVSLLAFISSHEVTEAAYNVWGNSVHRRLWITEISVLTITRSMRLRSGPVFIAFTSCGVTSWEAYRH